MFTEGEVYEYVGELQKDEAHKYIFVLYIEDVEDNKRKVSFFWVNPDTLASKGSGSITFSEEEEKMWKRLET